MAADDGNARLLFKWNETVFVFFGVWPLRSTYITFSLWLTFLLVHLSMENRDLYHVRGNAEEMVINISENTLALMVLVKMLILRFSTRLMNLIKRVIDDVESCTYESPEEEENYLIYNRIAKSFFRLWVITGFITAIIYHSKPLEFRIKSAFRNESLPFVLPYRTRHYFEIDSSLRFWLVWVLQSPTIGIHMFHAATIGCLSTLVLHMCGKLSVLIFRIKNLNLDTRSDPESVRLIFRDIVIRHKNILEISRDIGAVFRVVLLEELLVSTIIVGLTSYIVILHVNDEDKAVFLSCLMYGIVMMLLLYGYCIAGEYLLTESTNLYNVYYECDWYNLSNSFKKQMMICMIAAKTPIQLSGGGYYVFSLSSFTSILKTTGGYISMLRNLTEQQI